MRENASNVACNIVESGWSIVFDVSFRILDFHLFISLEHMLIFVPKGNTQASFLLPFRNHQESTETVW